MADYTSAHLIWRQGLRFQATSGSGHEVTLDSPATPGHAGAAPMELVAMGIAGCTAMDVVAILDKMHQQVDSCRVDITAERAPANPRYMTAIEIVYTLAGPGLDHGRVERAVALSRSTYCSAMASLRPDCLMTHRIEIVDS